ncbi:enzyme, putative [Theileria annulata]|uniref:Enzyme, putative n=1 Tax=Theileria annulata TaxID=5874 RepID=Q4UH42_THEAN|nr:enzyme, putative [Theileria annulata]CAI73597.1 enzyme, putative [Theileria annulata]|eukprot:XP_954274.1 enzyme, putative [Theileria annulata]
MILSSQITTKLINRRIFHNSNFISNFYTNRTTYRSLSNSKIYNKSNNKIDDNDIKHSNKFSKMLSKVVNQRNIMTQACLLHSVKSSISSSIISNSSINAQDEAVNGCENCENDDKDEADERLPRLWHYLTQPQPISSTMVNTNNIANNLKTIDNGVSSNDNRSFRVMSFNALAQSLVDDKYAQNDKRTMSWEYRREEILSEISQSNSDLLCFQEIDERDYVEFFKPKTEAMGYNSVYKRKLQDKLDGVLTLYRSQRYRLLLKNELEFCSQRPDFDKPQVALILALVDLRSSNSVDANDSAENLERSDDTKSKGNEISESDVLVLTNTHLIFNKSRGDIKLYQLCNLLKGIQKTIELINSSESAIKFTEPLVETFSLGVKSTISVTQEYKHWVASRVRKSEPSVIICADFNITPQSLIYNLIFNGFAPLRNSNRRVLSGQYLMFDNTYLTASTGHNESGETLGNAKHYISDIYSTKNKDKAIHSNKDKTIESETLGSVFTNNHSNAEETVKACNGNSDEMPENNNWYEEIGIDEEFKVKPNHVSSEAVEDFINLIKPKSTDLSREFANKLSLISSNGASNGDTTSNGVDNNNIGSGDVIYCPFKLSSAYAMGDSFNSEPAFTAFHGWQRGCVDYICYDPNFVQLEAIYEMPQYSQVKRNGDLPHKVLHYNIWLNRCGYIVISHTELFILQLYIL